MTVATEFNTQYQNSNNEYNDGDMATLPCSALCAAPWGNFRKTRSSEGKASLISSIKQQGVIQPIVIRPKADAFGQFEVLAGYGRWEGCQELGIASIPCLIRVCDDKTAMGIMLAENTERENMGPVDEAESADVILSECKGDEKEAAAMLGWTVYKLRQRMRLMRCPKEIRDMLNVKQENGFTLTLGHADELAAFPMDVQNKLILNVINKKLQPSDLRDLALNGKRKLERACFDKDECGQCQFNSDQQASLFADPSAEAVCTNISCYNKKTKAHLEQQRVELEAKHGQVILWGAVNESHRRPLLEHALGSEQYNNGCMSCKNRVAVLDDRPGHEGNVLESQCVDLNCYRQCVAAFNTPAAQVESTAPEPKSGVPATVVSAPVNVPTQTPAPAVKVELPSRIKNDNDHVMRQGAADVLMESNTFLLASMLVGLCQTAGYRNAALGLNGSLETNLLSAMKLEHDQLTAEISKAVDHFARKSDSTGYDMIRVMKQVGLTQPKDKIKTATTSRWEMNEERLALYTKDMQISMMKESGFEAAYINATSQKEFTALAGMKTDDRHKAILSFPFDWSHWAPAHLLNGWER